MAKKYYVYIIKCEKWKSNKFVRHLYYTEMTDNPKKRMYEHQHGMWSDWMVKNNIKPLGFKYLQEFDDMHEAHKKELQIKKMSVKRKEELIAFYNELMD